MSATKPPMAGPLEGIRIIEFGSFVAGPWGGQLLADMGADVIKVEPPDGDPWRHATPFAPNESRVFLPLNRGVRSICIDLKRKSSETVLRKLIEASDGIISNNRVDTAKKLGIDYDSVSTINPQLIYVDITAYGPKGPMADMPGFDLILQGYSGAVASEGKIKNGQPEVVWSSSFIDFSTGYAAANGILAGIIGRGKTGKGQLISTSLLGNAIGMQTLRIADIDGVPAPAKIWHENVYPDLIEKNASYEEIQESYQQAVRPSVYHCYYRAYKTLNGGLALGTLAVHARKRLLDVLGLKDPRVTNPDYDDTTSDAISESKRLVSKFEQIFASKSTQYWFKKLRSHDIPCEPIRYVEEMIDDEQVLANKYVIEMNHHTGKKIRTSGPVVRFGDGMPEEIPSPALGQHTNDILVDVGFSKDQITKLHSDGSVA
ncbi:MAG: CoA transferase [Dehalococcoidia bacterium]|nr:CoA transferase [Dehalococcoidia bacterium]